MKRKKTNRIIYDKKSTNSLEDLIVLAEADMLSDEEIIQSITDSIDDGLKLMRLSQNNGNINPCDCTDLITSIASRLSFATAVLNPNEDEEIKNVMKKIYSFCGSIITKKHCFVEKPELIEHIFPFFQTMREWVETLVLRENDYAVASNLSSSLLADLASFEAILGVSFDDKDESEDEEDSDDFFLL
jgi:hypothetical protein